jgi:hypothetical protein
LVLLPDIVELPAFHERSNLVNVVIENIERDDNRRVSGHVALTVQKREFWEAWREFWTDVGKPETIQKRGSRTSPFLNRN